MRSLITFAPDEAPWQTAVRRLLLLLSTWLTAHIFNLLCEISQAVDAQLRPPPPPPAAAADASSPGSSKPRPTLQAGFSCPFVKTAAGGATHAWTSLGADQFRVRCGPDYPRNGYKAPSGPAMAEVVAVDLLRSDKKVLDLMSHNHIALPKATPGWAELYPEFVVINNMMPVHFHNSLFTDETTDGETYHLVVYIRLPPGIARGWTSDQEPQNAEQLLLRFIMRAGEDPAIAHCFKEIGVVRNLDAIKEALPSSLYSLFKKFNGKPVLTRPEHSFHRDPHNRYFAVDIDGHRYKYFTRQALAQGLKYVDRVVMGFGYVVEARKEPELPEVMFACCELETLSLARAAPYPPQAQSARVEGATRLHSPRAPAASM